MVTGGAEVSAAAYESLFAELEPRVHYVDHGGPADAPVLVLVHGLGGSLLNWVRLAPLLTPTCRVVAVDLVGFGRTAAPGADASVEANAAVLDRFLRSVVGEPAVLVGNSMGCMVAALAALSAPDRVRGLALLDAVLPFPPGARSHRLVQAGFAAYAIPGLGRGVIAGRRRLRSPEQLARDTLWLCCADPGRVPGEVVDRHVELIRARLAQPGLDRQFITAARSLMRVIRDKQGYAARLRRLSVPVLLVHGARDRLVPVEAARAAAAANPRWRYVEAADAGHVPQLEIPEWTAAQLLPWLASLDREGGTAPA